MSYYKAVYVVEVLTDFPCNDMNLHEIEETRYFGGGSVSVSCTEFSEVDADEMAQLLTNQGSDPSVFIPDRDQEVDDWPTENIDKNKKDGKLVCPVCKEDVYFFSSRDDM